MKPSEVLDKTQDIDRNLVGVFLPAEVRAGWTKYGWQAYLVKYNKKGNISSVQVLRIKKGKRKGRPVKTMYHWEGIGHLCERIETLYKAKQI